MLTEEQQQIKNLLEMQLKEVHSKQAEAMELNKTYYYDYLRIMEKILIHRINSLPLWGRDTGRAL